MLSRFCAGLEGDTSARGGVIPGLWGEPHHFMFIGGWINRTHDRRSLEDVPLGKGRNKPSGATDIPAAELSESSSEVTKCID